MQHITIEFFLCDSILLDVSCTYQIDEDGKITVDELEVTHMGEYVNTNRVAVYPWATPKALPLADAILDELHNAIYKAEDDG